MLCVSNKVGAHDAAARLCKCVKEQCRARPEPRAPTCKRQSVCGGLDRSVLWRWIEMLPGGRHDPSGGGRMRARRIVTKVVALLALAACGEIANSDPSSQSPAEDDAFVHARRGMILCTSPNEGRKTCGSMIQFIFEPNGDVRAIGETMRNAEPLIASQGPVPMSLLPDGFCGEYRSELADTLTFTIDGAPASAEVTERIRADLRSRPNPPRACMQFSSTSTHTSVTVEGVAHPEMSERIIWISPDDGYVIGWPPQ